MKQFKLVKKKGFISTTVIYSFFVVFILLMVTVLITLDHYRRLRDDQKDKEKLDNYIECMSGSPFYYCLLVSQKIHDDPSDKDFINQAIKVQDKQVHVIDKDVLNRARNYFDAKTKDNKTSPDFNEIENEDKGMFRIEDQHTNLKELIPGKNDYSYYYRGNVPNNYVNFADKIWRIVRINGDGSVRLIYEGEAGSPYNKAPGIKTYNNEVNSIHYILPLIDIDLGHEISQSMWQTFKKELCCIKRKFQYPNTDTEQACLDNPLDYECPEVNQNYIDCIGNITGEITESAKKECDNIYYRSGAHKKHGYKYGDQFIGLFATLKWNETSIAKKWPGNIDDSNVKYYIDKWYEENIEAKNFSNFLSEGPSYFGGNKDWATRDTFLSKIFNTSNLETLETEGINLVYPMRIMDRFYVEEDNKEVIKPSLLATTRIKNGQIELRDYLYESKSKNTTNTFYLEYPVGMLTADEVVLAGGGSVHLNSEYDNWWDLFKTWKKSSQTKKNKYYLNTGSDVWTMNPSFVNFFNKNLNFANFNFKNGSYYYAFGNYGLTFLNDYDTPAYIRPVVNLKNTIQVCSGIGTKTKPYTVGIDCSNE